MFTMIIGGSASGKSKYAEEWVSSLGGNRIYLATMEPFGKEASERIKRHLAQRMGRGFETIERFTDLQHLVLPSQCDTLPEDPAHPSLSNVLLEDLGNLTANELFREDGGGMEAVLNGVPSLAERCMHLTVVTNDVFSGSMEYQGDTLYYLKAFARINRILAQKADHVVEVACGLPCFLK